jgi:hypothetical protein
VGRLDINQHLLHRASGPIFGAKMHRGSILGLLGAISLFCAEGTVAQAVIGKTGFTVSGVVRDESNTPMSDAQVSLTRAGEATRLFRTGADGVYSFTGLSAGSVLVSVRRLGFHGASQSVDVGAGMGSDPYDFHLKEIPSEVADVIVEGSKGHLDEYYNHKANNNFAKFFDGREIEKRHPAFLSELLRTVPGASLYASDRSGNRVMLRDCKPMVWLDGMRAPGAELDEVVRPTDVAGLEVYPSYAGLPPQYQDRNNRMCGAIMVWTKNQ